MSKWIDFVGTLNSFFQLGIGGAGVRSNSGAIEARNADNSAYGAIGASALNLYGTNSNNASLTAADGSGNFGVQFSANSKQIYYDFSFTLAADYHARFILSSATQFRFQGAGGLSYFIDTPLTVSGGLTTPGIIVTGNGALQTTGVGAGSVSGGSRGTGAVDLQVNRSDSSQVAAGTYSFVAGINNRAGGFGSFAVGANNIAASVYSATLGFGGASRRYAELVVAGGAVSATGDRQSSWLTISGQTNNGSPTVITTGNFVIPLANDSTIAFDLTVVARRADADNESAGWMLSGVIDRNTNAASTALVGTVTTALLAKDQTAWDVSADADTTNGGLRITVTGEASKTINWVASCRLTEVVG